MRVVTAGRVIAISVLLTVVGTSPRIIAFLAEHLPRTAEWWPDGLSMRPLFDQLTAFWESAAAKLYLATMAGAVLFAIGAGWALAMRIYEMSRGKDGSPDDPLRMSEVLLREAELVDGRQPSAEEQRHIDEFQQERKQWARKVQDEGPLNDVSPHLYRWLNSLDRSALCLSGGGIRSASFALGVLQALATHPRRPSDNRPVESAEKSLLSKFTFLSTVSGGGYIGSWLSAWIKRKGYPTVWRGLVRPPNDACDPGVEPRPIAWLREHGNYLTPQLGLTSPDTLTTVAIFLRNLALNWLVLLPLLCIPVLIMKIMALMIFSLSSQNSLALFVVLAVLSLVVFAFSLRFVMRHRPSLYRASDDIWKKQKADQARIIKRALLPNIVAAFTFTLCMALAAATKKDGKYGDWVGYLLAIEQGKFVWQDLATRGAIIGATLYAFTWIASLPRVTRGRDFGLWTLTGAIHGTLVAVVVYFFANDFIGDWIFYSLGEWVERIGDYIGAIGKAVQQGGGDNRTLDLKHTLVLIHFGVPLLLWAQMTAEMIFVGLSSYQLHSEDDREWLGRSAALSLLVSAGWLIVMYLIFVGGDIAYKMMMPDRKETKLLVAALALTAVLAALLGRSHRTAAQSEPVVGVKPKSVRLVLSIAAIACAGLLVIIVSALLDRIILWHPITEPGQLGSDFFSLMMALAVLWVIGTNASKFINVNRFSIHSLYRNRLVRTFLGATRDPRAANPFTNFDEEDNVSMCDLWPGVGAKSHGQEAWRPFHIINIALNVTASEKRLAWQERKAAPFVVTPLYCGSAVVGFRDTCAYGNKISLGTAMAISGAAASPNQGYNSSAPIAFLMALLNVRLGWWLGNPGTAGKKTFKDEGPRTAARSLLAELVGMTREDQEYVYLSDGGHFENLGIYEMVRRRCKLIVVSDAGCDPGYVFEDLGNAVRKIVIDLGVPIRFRGLSDLKPRRADGRDIGPGHSYHAIGEIDYPAADGGGDKGFILYLKPGYHGSEITAAVRSYAMANRQFPHDDTINQWFGESQIESYRALGFEIMDNLLSSAQEGLKGKADITLADVIDALQSPSLHPPSSASGSPALGAAALPSPLAAGPA